VASRSCSVSSSASLAASLAAGRCPDGRTLAHGHRRLGVGLVEHEQLRPRLRRRRHAERHHRSNRQGRSGASSPCVLSRSDAPRVIPHDSVADVPRQVRVTGMGESPVQHGLPNRWVAGVILAGDCGELRTRHRLQATRSASSTSTIGTCIPGCSHNRTTSIKWEPQVLRVWTRGLNRLLH
jgi:hypothetical protein